MVVKGADGRVGPKEREEGYALGGVARVFGGASSR